MYIFYYIRCLEIILKKVSWFRICAVLCDFKSYSVLIASVYMPCDDHSTINEYNFVLSCIEAAEQKYKPTYVIVGGDYNTDLSRVNSLHTKSLHAFCE